MSSHCKSIKEHTPMIREYVHEWLSSRTNDFNVSDIIRDHEGVSTGLDSIYLCKAISNELARLERRHKLSSRHGVKGVDGCGVGRTPKVFSIKVEFRLDRGVTP